MFLLDDAPAATFTQPSVTVEQDGVQFFSSGQLDVNNHFLDINITGTTPENPFFFDYAIVTHAAALTTDPFSTSSSSPSQTSSVSNVLSLTGPSSSPTLSTQFSTSSTSSVTTALLPAQTSGVTDTAGRSSNHLGAIVGGVLGGLAGLLLLLFALYYLWRRQRSVSPNEPESGEKEGKPIVYYAS